MPRTRRPRHDYQVDTTVGEQGTSDFGVFRTTHFGLDTGVYPEPEARFASPHAYTPKHLAEHILTSKAALEGERKQVTVLFADLKGSMELLADRDPKEARKLLDPVTALTARALQPSAESRFAGTAAGRAPARDTGHVILGDILECGRMTAYLIVALGSGIGGALRHAVNVGAARLLGTGWPSGTFTVNVLGSFAIGLIAGYFVLRGHTSQGWLLFLTTGVLGRFTTFRPSLSTSPCSTNAGGSISRASTPSGQSCARSPPSSWPWRWCGA